MNNDPYGNTKPFIIMVSAVAALGGLLFGLTPL